MNKIETRYIDMVGLIALIDKHNLKNQSRKRENVWKRSAIAYVLRERGFTLDVIGNLLNKNHATIIHYLKLYANNVIYTDFASFLDMFEEEIELLYDNISLDGTLNLAESIVRCSSYSDFISLKRKVIKTIKQNSKL